MSDLSFEEYVELHQIQPGEYGAAFAAWLNETAGWDGGVRRVDDVGDES